MLIGWRSAKNDQICLIGWTTWPPGDKTIFSYLDIGITLKIFLSKSTMPIENNSKLMVIEWPSNKIVYIFIGWKTWLPGVESVFLYGKIQIFLAKYYLVNL